MTEGTYLKTKREKMNVTQKDLAEKLGLKSGQFINNIENNRAHIPVKYFKKISEILSINVESLVRLKVKNFKQSILKELEGP